MFVAFHHADVEEAAILLVAALLQQAFVGIAVVLRRLHQRHLRIAERRYDRLQPIRRNLVVAVDDTDEGRGRVGQFQRLVQRAGLEALHAVEMEEAEARPQRLAMRFNGTPVALRRGVVVEHDHFEIGIVETRQARRSYRSPSAAVRCESERGSTRAAFRRSRPSAATCDARATGSTPTQRVSVSNTTAVNSTAGMTTIAPPTVPQST